MTRAMGRGAALIFGLAALVAAAAPARAADKLRIGFISSLSGPTSLTGDELLRGFQLGIASLGGRMGGREVELITGDDQTKTEIGLQLAQKMIESDNVDLLTGIVLSNVMMAVTKAFEPAQTFFISINAGPSPLAGKLCSPYFFSASYQGDQAAEAMGAYLSEQHVDNMYLMAANYQAGRDMLNGFKRTYKGHIAGEVLTSMGQLDYAAELATVRSTKPGGVFFFYTSGVGINFLKQYEQSGLKATAPLFATNFSVDQSMLPSVGVAADGVLNTSFWAETLDNPANHAFVTAYQAAYHTRPSVFAASAYDTTHLIDAALTSIGGRTDDKQAMRKALEQVRFDSIRGHFRFNTNHFPIQDFYLLKVGRGADGAAENQVLSTVMHDAQDSYVQDCAMK
jgi:branched-chain amino acid transport system substrate-binding protein